MKSSVLDDRKIRDAIKDKWLKLPVQINQCDCEALLKQARQKAYTQGCVDTKLYWEDEVKKARQKERIKTIDMIIKRVVSCGYGHQ